MSAKKKYLLSLDFIEYLCYNILINQCLDSEVSAELEIDKNKYPMLYEYAHPLQKPNRPVIGREHVMQVINAALHRPELCNVMLIGSAGTGKTMVVQGLMIKDTKRKYLEVDLAKMIANLNDNNEMANRLKRLFDDAQCYRVDTDTELVLFIDEFHQICQLSPAAVEAMKPILADSGVRGIRVIAATTTEEFIQWIKPNLPLQERLQRINLPTVDKDVTISILKSMAKTYGIDNQFYNDYIFQKIVEYTDRYIPASVQPRKSIRIFDAMVGWHRSENRKMDEKLLAEVIQESENVKVNFTVDATSIKEELDKRVLSQQYATRVIQNRLQICTAGMNDPSRPMSSFLFCGSTGVGKTEITKQLANLLFADDRSLIRFDMTEYSNPDSLERFRVELTNRVWARPYSIILFDEIEKACGEVTRILLQVLDDGRLIDENDREVTFTNAYIIMTTNAGNEIYKTIAQYNEDDTGSGEQIMRYDKVIRRSLVEAQGSNRFPPELLGRIDCIVPFQPLSHETQKQIVVMKLNKIKEKVLKLHNIKLSISQDVVTYLVDDRLDTQSDSGGARDIMNKINSEVIGAISIYINEHKGREVRQLYVYVEGKMASSDKTKLVSEAYIKVSAKKPLKVIM